MYDRPPAMFHQTTPEKQHDLFLRLSTQYAELGDR